MKYVLSFLALAWVIYMTSDVLIPLLHVVLGVAALAFLVVLAWQMVTDGGTR